MRRFRTIMNQSPAIIISVIALTFSLGGGAGYAASVAAKASPPKITWHKLPLRNGWQAGSKTFGSSLGNPGYTVSNSIVYLTGVADQPSQSVSLPSVIGVLPKSARPKHCLWFTAYNYAASGESEIAVFPNGDVEVLGTQADQGTFTSLAGIEFPLGS
jgi:hypothetical protein